MDEMHGFYVAPSTNINFDVIYLSLAYVMFMLVFDRDLPLSGLLPQEQSWDAGHDAAKQHVEDPRLQYFSRY